MPRNSLQIAPYGVNAFTGVTCLLDGLSGRPGAIVSTSAYPTIVWEPNIPFHATLEFIESVWPFRVKVFTTGREYNMFPSDVNDYLVAGLITGKQLVGDWHVVKKNTSYGIALVR